MTRGCRLCQRSPATRCLWCKLRFCAEHELQHDCPPQQAIAIAADDPTLKKRALAERAPEGALTTQVIAALNALGDVHVTRLDSGSPRQRGNRLSEPGAPDVIGYSYSDGRFIGVETKGSHGPSCNREACGCRLQREWGARLVAAGGVYVGNVRRLQDAIDGVRMGLARARGQERSAG